MKATFSLERRCVTFLVVLFLSSGVHPAWAQDNVAGTLHNLSASGPGRVRSLDEKQICIFCHIPHNAVSPVPLWGHRLSSADYRVPGILSSHGGKRPAPQPDGSSRLCLSCHDGTIAVGETGERHIRVSGGERLSPGHRGFIGTDLSGSHPISFVVTDGADFQTEGSDMALRPLSLVNADPDIRLDDAGKMQCTTCHNPHSDQYFKDGAVPHFWVKPSVQEVCLTCHMLR